MGGTLNDIKIAIERSGFPLEHYIGLVLKQHGWQIITNRNYIDDIKGIEREIDILAYKLYADKKENIEYITTLIISCKKSNKHKWCFLTRDINEDDCNIDSTPFHYCTSDKRLEYMTEHHLDTIVEKYKNHRAVKHLYSFNELVFAYQQLAEPAHDKDRKNGNLCIGKNDDIYNSISTTIKAISNEKDSRLRAYDYSAKQRYYTFHALSIFEGDMYNAHFDSNSEVDVQEISHIKYLNRHIVSNVDDFYIVHFIQRKIFDYRLRIFDYMHEENVRTLPKLINSFYHDIFKHRDRVNMYWDECSRELGEIIHIYADNDKHPIHTTAPLPRLSFMYEHDKLAIYIEGDFFDNDEILTELNSNEVLQKDVREILERYYRYSGQFTFTNGFRVS